MTYSVEDILEIIKHYNLNIINIQSYKPEYKSVGVSVVDDMPSANTISNVVESEALRQVENSLFYSQLATDIKYLEQRLNRVETSRDKEVLKLRMNGYRVLDISEVLGVSRQTTYRILYKVAAQIKSG